MPLFTSLAIAITGAAAGSFIVTPTTTKTFAEFKRCHKESRK